MPLFGPPWHKPSPGQMGQGCVPTEQNPPPVHGVLSVQTAPALSPPTQ